MTNRRTEAASNSQTSARPVIVANPPRPNVALLSLSGLAWLAWLGFLIWLAWRLS